MILALFAVVAVVGFYVRRVRHDRNGQRARAEIHLPNADVTGMFMNPVHPSYYEAPLSLNPAYAPADGDVATHAEGSTTGIAPLPRYEEVDGMNRKEVDDYQYAPLQASQPTRENEYSVFRSAGLNGWMENENTSI